MCTSCSSWTNTAPWWAASAPWTCCGTCMPTNSTATRLLHVGLEQAVEQAVDGPRLVVGLGEYRRVQWLCHLVTDRRLDYLPGADARVERAAEDAGLLGLRDDSR